MEKISWIHLIILSLATFRLTHLIVYDKITAFIRKPFLESATELDESGNSQQVIRIKGSGLIYWAGSLLSCYWCTGIWSTIAIVLIYMYFPTAFPVLVVLAVAGVAAIIESFIQ